MIHVQIVKQVPVGILQARNLPVLSSVNCPTDPRRITRDFGRDVRACTKRNREAKSSARYSSICVLQCLVVAVRPLRVEELAKILAIDFDDEELPKLNLHWSWEDQEQALMSSCSSLIAIAESDESRIVEFSHFSVKEFLTSYQLASSNGDISRYHIDLEPAHIILAQACMSVLLRWDDLVEEGGIGNISPLVGYAAEH